MEIKVKIISSNAKRGTAQVVLIQPDATRKGKNVSETRHLKNKGGNRWTDAAGNVFTGDGSSFKLGAE